MMMMTTTMKQLLRRSNRRGGDHDYGGYGNMPTRIVDRQAALPIYRHQVLAARCRIT
jgi:hypothetical protein